MNHILSLIVFVLLDICANNAEGKTFAYVGSYTSPSKDWVKGTRGNGIEVYELNPRTGRLLPRQTVNVSIAGDDPSYIAISNNSKFLFSINEVFGGALRAFRILKDGKLILINSKSLPGFNLGAHLVVGNNDKYVHVAYYDGQYAVFPINKDGSISNPSFKIKFVGKSHAHQVSLSHDGKFVYICDLGGDIVRSFQFDSSKGIATALPVSYKTETKAGPRHMSFHPTKPWVYLLDELTSEVEFLQQDSNSGELKMKQKYSTVQTGKKQGAAAAIRVDPSGKYLYCTNRIQENSIVLFSINQRDGTLKKEESYAVGVHPREFQFFEDTHMYVLSQDTNMIHRFKKDSTTGKLTNREDLRNSPGNPIIMQIVKVKTKCGT